MSTNVELRLPRAAEMVFALTMRDLMYVPVMQDILEMGHPAMVCKQLITKYVLHLSHGFHSQTSRHM